MNEGLHYPGTEQALLVEGSQKIPVEARVVERLVSATTGNRTAVVGVDFY